MRADEIIGLGVLVLLISIPLRLIEILGDDDEYQRFGEAVGAFWAEVIAALTTVLDWLARRLEE